MEEVGGLTISGCSSSSTLDDEIGCTWDNWAPVDVDSWNDWLPAVIDCGPISAAAASDDFHSLVDTMMCTDSDGGLDATAAAGFGEMHAQDLCGHDNSNPGSTTTSVDTPPDSESGGAGDEKGVRLVHLLMAAAEALSGPDKSPELARVILVRLKELASPTGGTGMERLAAHFASALQGLLDGAPSAVGPGRHPSSSSHRGGGGGGGGAAAAGNGADDYYGRRLADVVAAFQLLQDMAPDVKFCFFTANQAILDAADGHRRVHIVDFDVAQGVQWSSLMQALVSRKGGIPPPHLRITAVTGGGGGKRSAAAVQETGKRLAAFAESLGQPFSFGTCRADADERFRPAAVKLVKGEVLIMNCKLFPPPLPGRRAAVSVESFLSGAAGLGAKVVTLVEEEVVAEGGFVGRFMGELHRYSAMWDSLEAGFPMEGKARELVERTILGPRIAGSVARAYVEKKEDEAGGWGEWMAANGFGRVALSCFNHCQARLLLGLFNEGYRVEEDAANKLVLAWKSRRLLSASVWSPRPPPPAAASSPAAPPAPLGGFANGCLLDDSDFFLR